MNNGRPQRTATPGGSEKSCWKRNKVEVSGQHEKSSKGRHAARRDGRKSKRLGRLILDLGQTRQGLRLKSTARRKNQRHGQRKCASRRCSSQIIHFIALLLIESLPPDQRGVHYSRSVTGHWRALKRTLSARPMRACSKRCLFSEIASFVTDSARSSQIFFVVLFFGFYF